MSIASEITRLQGLRNAIRTKLLGLGIIVDASADLEDCADAIDDITDNAGVAETLDTTVTEYTVPEGYHDGTGKVSIVLETKSATPSSSSQDITPSTGKVLSKVTVNPIPGSYADVSGVTATAGDVLANKIFVTSGGVETAGTMPNNGTVNKTIDGLIETQYTIPAGYHSGSGKVTLSNDIETALAAI